MIALASSQASITTSYTYDPFGRATSTGAPSANRYQYTGRENDSTGLQYNRARYYNPSIGRFISQDPLGQAGSGTNLYQYANDNPVNLTDPTGQSADPTIFTGPGLCLVSVLSGAKDGAAAAGCIVGTLLMFLFPEMSLLDEELVFRLDRTCCSAP